MTNSEIKNLMAIIKEVTNNLDDGQTLRDCKLWLTDGGFLISSVRDEQVTDLYFECLACKNKFDFGARLINLFYAVKRNLKVS